MLANIVKIVDNELVLNPDSAIGINRCAMLLIGLKRFYQLHRMPQSFSFCRKALSHGAIMLQ